MTEKGIIFSGPMVRAILDGKKRMTRRVMNPQPSSDWTPSSYGAFVMRGDMPVVIGYGYTNEDGSEAWCCRFRPGDILYVREAFCPNYFDDWTPAYKADYDKYKIGDVVPEPKWKPAIHMPRDAARIWLRVTGVEAQRLRDISEDDAIGEGFEGMPCPHTIGTYACTDCMNTGWLETPIDTFIQTWDSIYGKKPGCAWIDNPWVWKTCFERTERQGQA
jgi:hypothetical protein